MADLQRVFGINGPIDSFVQQKLRPLIGKVFPLREAAAAHRLQEENTTHKAGTLMGKIVLAAVS